MAPGGPIHSKLYAVVASPVTQLLLLFTASHDERCRLLLLSLPPHRFYPSILSHFSPFSLPYIDGGVFLALPFAASSAFTCRRIHPSSPAAEEHDANKMLKDDAGIELS